jgi:hypothetical protein
MLFEEWKEPCVMLEKRRVSDGEGGFSTEWVESAEFEAAITFDSSMEARTAEHDGVTSLYTVTTSKNAILQYHDVFRRTKDGKIFRATSDGDDLQTPDSASFSFSQVTAEEWELTT